MTGMGSAAMKASEKVLNPEIIVSAYSSSRQLPGEGQRKYASTGLYQETRQQRLEVNIQETYTQANIVVPR